MTYTLGFAAFFAALLRLQPWGHSLLRLLAGALGYLLPVAVAALIAVAAVLFLSLIQGGGPSSGLLSAGALLSLVAAFAALVFYAYQPTAPEAEGDGPGPAQALPLPLLRGARWAAYLLPVFALLALYGLTVRASEYGLTEMRVLGLSAGF